jgi:hypothetical protein
MSFQAYLDTIQKKTGKGPDEFRKLAKQRGLLRADVKAGEIVAWLKSEFGLGHGHAMAIYGVLRSTVEPPITLGERLDEHFKGRRAKWRDSYATIVKKVSAFGKDKPSIKMGDSYLSLLRKGKKFAILKIGVDFLDIGIKLKKGAPVNKRLQEAGDWNTMVSHRVRLASPDDFDDEVLVWLKAAYDTAH